MQKPQQVVILSDHSIFAEGVAKRFQQYPDLVNLHLINPQEEDAFVRISEIQPSAVILNASEAEMKTHCALCELITSFTSIKIIRLAVDREGVQLITSEQSQLGEIRDLIGLIDS